MKPCGPTGITELRETYFKICALVVLLLAGSLFFIRLGDRSLWGSEGRWTEVTREMQLTQNYFWPTINGQVYYDKPLLSYWLIAGAARVTGGVNELASRLPGALAGLLGTALLIVLTRRLYDGRTAIIAGCILATSYSYVYWSRTASADVETVTGVLAALTLFFFNHERRHQRWVVGLWLIMAVTSLIKGLQGFALPLLIIGVYSLFAQGWRTVADKLLRGSFKERIAWLVMQNGWFFNRATLLATMIAGVIYLAPFVISFVVTNSNQGLFMVLRENVLRFVEPFDHEGPIYLYVYGIFVLMAPWCLFLPAAMVHAHSKPAAKRERFILAYFWTTFIFFTLSGSRRDYYLLPILPAAAILIAGLFTSRRDTWNRWTRRLVQGGYFMTASLVLLTLLGTGIAAFLSSLRPDLLNHLPAQVEQSFRFGFWVFLAMLILLAPFYRNLVSQRLAWSLFFTAYGFMFLLFIYVLPNTEPLRGEKAFAQSVRATLNGHLDKLVLYKTGGANMIYYLGAEKPIPEFFYSENLTSRIDQDPDVWIVAEEVDPPNLPFPLSTTTKSADYRWTASGFVGKYVLLHVDQDRSKTVIAQTER
ncbi:MAG TPA: glycosyltransferase family 39 protein [Candidatus Binatia bacterium]